MPFHLPYAGPIGRNWPSTRQVCAEPERATAAKSTG